MGVLRFLTSGWKPDAGGFRQRVRAIRMILLGIVLVCLCVLWLSGIMDRRIDQWVDSGRSYNPAEMPDDGRPAFMDLKRGGGLTGPQGHWWSTPSNLPLNARLGMTYYQLKDTLGLRNPANWTIPAFRSNDSGFFLCQGLNMCMRMSGKRYLVAREAPNRIPFGPTNTLNGAQWVAAFEQAARSNGLVLIPESRRVVKVIPKEKLEEYRKAGLIKRGT